MPTPETWRSYERDFERLLESDLGWDGGPQSRVQGVNAVYYPLPAEGGPLAVCAAGIQGAWEIPSAPGNLPPDRGVDAFKRLAYACAVADGCPPVADAWVYWLTGIGNWLTRTGAPAWPVDTQIFVQKATEADEILTALETSREREADWTRHDQYRQAQHAFTAARLLVHSSTVAPQDEHARDGQVYFAQPTDSNEQLERKQTARKNLLTLLRLGPERNHDRDSIIRVGVTEHSVHCETRAKVRSIASLRISSCTIHNICYRSVEYCRDLAAGAARGPHEFAPSPSLELAQVLISEAAPAIPSAGAARSERCSWDDVVLEFTSEERVQLTVKGRVLAPQNYEDMGCADGRTQKPNLAWIALRQLAEAAAPVMAGEFESAQLGPDHDKRLQEIRRHLKAYLSREGFTTPPEQSPLTSQGGRVRSAFKLGTRLSYAS